MPENQGQAISWEVVTHVHNERTNDWYWALGVVALAGAGLSIWLGNVLFAAVIAIAAICLGFLAARGPREHSVRVDQRGISIDGTLHPYRSLQSFWIPRHEDEELRLYITTHGVFMPHLSIPLESRAQADQVRSLLKRSVAEEEQEPHLGEHVAELLGL